MEILWCCHVRGPDDVIPTDGYDEAVALADEINNISIELGLKRSPFEWLSRAVPAVWPYSPQLHAADLAAAKDDAIGVAAEHDQPDELEKK